MNSLFSCALFDHIDHDDCKYMLTCLEASEQFFKKGQHIFLAQDTPIPAFIVKRGKVLIQSEDYWGKVSILSTVQTGELYGGSFSYAQELPMIGAVAGSDCTLCFINYKRILTTCKNSCSFHSKMIENLVGILSQNNIALTQKMLYLTQSTTKDKLLLFLSDSAKKAGSNTFTIPFTRQQLADFLSVERSAMSTVLSKMKSQGIIDYDKNTFTLTQ